MFDQTGMSIGSQAARRLRLVRLSLGYRSATAFARAHAIGYPAAIRHRPIGTASTAFRSSTGR